MIYTTPPLSDNDRLVLDEIETLRERLSHFLRTPRRWSGTLRRATLARAVQGSNSIEGYHASVEDVAAVIDDEEPIDADAETLHAIEGYRDAMTYVMQIAASSPRPVVDESLLKSLHFMMLKHDLQKNPGQWRAGAVWVSNDSGDVVYEAPPHAELDMLISELVSRMNTEEGDPTVRATMAHLNLALIHPFSDGNGRMARCIQSLVLTEQGPYSPEFLSIEEYLGRNTNAYYAALTEVAQGSWSPGRDARPWLRFCLTAHYRQALTLLRRIEEIEALWDQCDQLARRHRLPDRCVGALCDAARGWRTRRALYVKTVRSSIGEEITADTATRDLRSMARAGLLEPVGQRRGRYYQPSQELRSVWHEIRGRRRARGVEDPYALAQQQLPVLDP